MPFFPRALFALALVGAATTATANDDTICTTNRAAITQVAFDQSEITAGKAAIVLQNQTSTAVRLVGLNENAGIVMQSGAQMVCTRELNPVPIAVSVVRVSDGARLQTFSLRDAIGPKLTFIVSEGGVILRESQPRSNFVRG
ncbi:MAG: hypothetical protein AAFQ36_12850 [Pseudomonadota bacterium]